MEYWESVHGALTPGGDPFYKCPRCKDKRSGHVYGIESRRRLNKCPVCGIKLLYPGETDVKSK